MRFPYLTASDVEVRVGQCSEKGAALLLYKDARCDMRILDDAVGADGWQCHYSIIGGKLFCNVALWSNERQCWVSKEDVGVPSNMESEKGEASDAFKRACFKWGIGRELYTAPFIWVPSSKCSIVRNKQGKPSCYDKFVVTGMEVRDGSIVALSIANAKTGAEVFSTGFASVQAPKPHKEQNPAPEAATAPQADANATVSERKRAWYNIKAWAANHGGDPKALLEGVKQRMGYEDSAYFWSVIADEFAE